MLTFQEIVFGPIHSRRFGCSLGINLLPLKKKFCTFDCIYCECGLGEMKQPEALPSLEAIETALRCKLIELKANGVEPDVFTFAGNGEPPLHPAFPQIVSMVCRYRDEYFPKARITVLSNATRIDHAEVRKALLKVDNNVLKLDAASDELMRWMNQPWLPNFNVADLVKQLKWFQGKLMVQTMFLRGTHQGRSFDNTSEENVSAWIRLVAEIVPQSVTIYSIDRETPVSTLEKIPSETLQRIADRLLAETGIPSLVTE